MDDQEMEQRAAAVRAEILRIWEGDAAKSDEWMCFIMAYVRDAYALDPPADADEAAGRERLMRMMSLLIQR
jgi:hypothetical protein